MIIMENVNIQEEIYVGIDLGTTNTLACWMNKGKPSLFKFKGSRNKSMLPSVLYVEEDGSVMVGQDAKQAMILDPDNGVRSSKTYIGKFGGREDKYKNPYVCHGRKFNPTEVAAEVLSTVKKTIIKKAKCDDDAVIKAVITVPAYFNQNQKDETRKAGEMAGLQVLRVLVEPTAAALAAVKEIDIDGKVLVVDLGGGTFDLSLLQVDNINNSYTAIDVDGNERLGGDDFNRVIYEYFVEELQKEYGIDLTSFNTSGSDKNEYHSVKVLQDILTIARNLGFKTGMVHLPDDFAEKTYIYFENSDKIFTEYKVYKNGNMHVKFNQEFTKAMNVEVSRLLGWIRTPEDIKNEFPTELAKGAEKYFKVNKNLLVNNNLKLLTCG